VLSLLPSTSQGVLGVGLLASLWGASMAVGALITTINRAYNIRPRRNIATQKLLSILLTLALSSLWLMAMTIILVGPDITQDIYEYMGIASETNTFWTSVRLPMVFLLNMLALSLLYYIAPEAKQKFRWILPGAVTSTLLWMLASQAFREFISRFGTYNKTYGSLAALVILMMWLWLSGLVFLLGAEINSLMKRLETDDPNPPFRPLR
jgi:membrane protein